MLHTHADKFNLKEKYQLNREWRKDVERPSICKENCAHSHRNCMVVSFAIHMNVQCGVCFISLFVAVFFIYFLLLLNATVFSIYPKTPPHTHMHTYAGTEWKGVGHVYFVLKSFCQYKCKFPLYDDAKKSWRKYQRHAQKLKRMCMYTHFLSFSVSVSFSRAHNPWKIRYTILFIFQSFGIRALGFKQSHRNCIAAVPAIAVLCYLPKVISANDISVQTFAAAPMVQHPLTLINSIQFNWIVLNAISCNACAAEIIERTAFFWEWNTFTWKEGASKSATKSLINKRQFQFRASISIFFIPQLRI